MFELSNYRHPTNSFWELWRKMDREFDRGFGLGDFKIDLKDEGDSFRLEAELPGFQKEDIKLEVDEDYLTISAEHTEEKKEEKEGKLLHSERHYGKYQRTFNIANVDEKNITANYKDGVLQLKMPKKSPQKTIEEKRTIAIE